VGIKPRFRNKELKFLSVPILIQTPHKRLKTEFIIDTGSPYTILNYTDSIRLGIPHHTKSELVRIGGREYQSYISKCEIILKSINNDRITETIYIRVLKPSSTKINELENLDRLPNILGLDFLLSYKFICDISNNEIYLEKAENQ